MKKEHYEYIVSKFSIKIGGWRASYDGQINVTNLWIEQNCTHAFWGWEIRQSVYPYYVFSGIPSKELAEEILQHTIDTEILFS